MKRSTFLLTLSIVLFGTTTLPAHAYLDPGNGSMLIQIIVGGVAAIAVGFKYYWHQLMSFFRGNKPVPEKEEE